MKNILLSFLVTVLISIFSVGFVFVMNFMLHNFSSVVNFVILGGVIFVLMWVYFWNSIRKFEEEEYK